MYILQKAKNILDKQTGFIQYHYAAYMRNYYPCKLVGEKPSESTSGTIVVFNKAGNAQSSEIPIKELLSDLALIAHFNPEEASKIGFIALEQFIFEVPVEERALKFNQIKNIMLNFTRDINQDFSLTNLFFDNDYCKLNTDNKKVNFYKNIYPYRLVGEKNNSKVSGTKIIYTTLGKREGYNRSLQDLISNKDLISKFHPTEAVKFGFIYMGDILFGFSNQVKKQG